MSIKINWEAIKLSQYDGLSYLQSHLSTLSLPDAINSIDITSLDLGYVLECSRTFYLSIGHHHLSLK